MVLYQVTNFDITRGKIGLTSGTKNKLQKLLMEANPFLKYAQQKTHKLRPSLQCWRFRNESRLKNTIFLFISCWSRTFFLFARNMCWFFCKFSNSFSDLVVNYYRPPTKLRGSNVFSRVCPSLSYSVQGRGRVTITNDALDILYRVPLALDLGHILALPTGHQTWDPHPQ